MRIAGELDFNPAIRLEKTVSNPSRPKNAATATQRPSKGGQPRESGERLDVHEEIRHPPAAVKSRGRFLKTVALPAIIGGLIAGGGFFLFRQSEAADVSETRSVEGGSNSRRAGSDQMAASDASGSGSAAGSNHAQISGAPAAPAVLTEARTGTAVSKLEPPEETAPSKSVPTSPAASLPAAPAAPENSAQPRSEAVPTTPLGVARHVLDQFLTAPDWETRLALSLNADTIRDTMAVHFRDHPDGPIPVEGVAWLTNGKIPGTDRQYYGFRVGVRDLPADIPVAVEDTGKGFRVDWLAFLETYEQRLKAFVASPRKEPGQFRVVLRRKHYYGDPVPGQDKTRLSFGVECPMRDEAFPVWVNTESELYKKEIIPANLADWEVESFLIVELVWRGAEKSGQWVELNRIVANNWQGR